MVSFENNSFFFCLLTFLNRFHTEVEIIFNVATLCYPVVASNSLKSFIAPMPYSLLQNNSEIFLVILSFLSILVCTYVLDTFIRYIETLRENISRMCSGFWHKFKYDAMDFHSNVIITFYQLTLLIGVVGKKDSLMMSGIRNS